MTDRPWDSRPRAVYAGNVPDAATAGFPSTVRAAQPREADAVFEEIR